MKLKPLCELCELCASVVNLLRKNTHHRDTEHTKDAQRGASSEFPTLIMGATE